MPTPHRSGRGLARHSGTRIPIRARDGSPLAAVLSGLDFGLATTPEHYEGAFRLVHDRYVFRGYMRPHPSGRRLSSHHALPTTKVFVATHGTQVVATLSLIQDSPLGLPMDEIYREELAPVRAAGRCPCEASGLAVDPRYRAVGVAVLARLVRMLVLYAAETVRLDDLCIVVNPRHVGFYLALFDAEVLGPQRAYRRVNGAPAQALRLDLHGVRRLIRQLRSGAPAGAVAEFFYGPAGYGQVMATLARELPFSALSPAEFARLFGDHEVTAAPVEAGGLVRSLYPTAPAPRPTLTGFRETGRRWRRAWPRQAAALAAGTLLVLGPGLADGPGPPTLPTLPANPPSASEAGPGHAPEVAEATWRPPLPTSTNRGSRRDVADHAGRPEAPGSRASASRPEPRAAEAVASPGAGGLPPPGATPAVALAGEPALIALTPSEDSEAEREAPGRIAPTRSNQLIGLRPETDWPRGASGPIAWEVVGLRREALPETGQIRWSYRLIIREQQGMAVRFVREERVVRQNAPDGVVVPTAFQRADAELSRDLAPSASLELEMGDGVLATAREPGFGPQSQLEDIEVWHRLVGTDDAGRPVRIDIRFPLSALADEGVRRPVGIAASPPTFVMPSLSPLPADRPT